MSDKQRASSSKIVSTNALNNNLKLRQVASAKITFNSNATVDPLLTKEEEYRRLNEELEKKTAALVRDAEQVLKANENLINETDQLSKISEINFLTNEIAQNSATPSGLTRTKKEKSILFDINELAHFKQTIDNLENNEENIEREDYNLEDEEEEESSKPNLLIPKSANEMSNEAQIRFLKAKLKVMQEELERYQFDLNKREEENLKLAQRCKELDEDRAKQLRISNSHQTQMDKFKKLNEEAQAKLTAQEIQIQSIKKENDQLKKDGKKFQVDQQQVDLRLNRALEEIEKYKQQLNKTQASSKDVNEQEKRRIEQLQSDNKRLQKQKLELIQAFKKQLKLIDILKKQKMHLEAAKMLQFSEDEFVNALEWNNTNAAPPVTQQPSKPTNNLNNRPPSGSTNRSNKNVSVQPKQINQQQQHQQQNIQKLFADSSKNDFNANYEDDDEDDENQGNNNELNDYENETKQNYNYDEDEEYETPMYNNVKLEDDDDKY